VIPTWNLCAKLGKAQKSLSISQNGCQLRFSSGFKYLTINLTMPMAAHNSARGSQLIHFIQPSTLGESSSPAALAPTMPLALMRLNSLHTVSIGQFGFELEEVRNDFHMGLQV
jgi:hypothetical protein